MTAPKEESADAQARRRVRADERTLRRGFTLRDARREFLRHPSPWLIGSTLVATLIARIALGDWRISDALVPIAMIAVFPFFEWVVHVFILHWRPKRVAGVTLDSLLARKHREHHTNPRDIPLIFIPWPALLWILPGTVAIALLAFPRVELGLTFLLGVTVLGAIYEWTHYLIHSDYPPKGRLYKSVWRNHRLHHYKNEHYWFSVTTAGTSDRVLRTYPDAGTVEKSPTAKNLHAMS